RIPASRPDLVNDQRRRQAAREKVWRAIPILTSHRFYKTPMHRQGTHGRSQNWRRLPAYPEGLLDAVS
ncbi:MAG: hypothetical protein VYB59_09335, partial [Pseudomonadota bacterium]|nr:hypothetical protein [Pseudomonadota bacterium]